MGYLLHSLLVKCADPRSCIDTAVHCPITNPSRCDIRCLEDASCSPVMLYVDNGFRGLKTNISSNLTANSVFRCDADFPLKCEGIYIHGPLLPCIDEEDCVFNCTRFEDGCSHRTIDARTAQSFDLQCGTGNNTCQYSTILCPTAHDASCTVRCDKMDACLQIQVTITGEY